MSIALSIAESAVVRICGRGCKIENCVYITRMKRYTLGSPYLPFADVLLVLRELVSRRLLLQEIAMIIAGIYYGAVLPMIAECSSTLCLVVGFVVHTWDTNSGITRYPGLELDRQYGRPRGIVCGIDFVMVWTDYGRHMCGANDFRELGLGDSEIHVGVTCVPMACPIVAAACGSSHTVVICQDGESTIAYEWGSRRGIATTDPRLIDIVNPSAVLTGDGSVLFLARGEIYLMYMSFICNKVDVCPSITGFCYTRIKVHYLSVDVYAGNDVCGRLTVRSGTTKWKRRDTLVTQNKRPDIASEFGVVISYDSCVCGCVEAFVTTRGIFIAGKVISGRRLSPRRIYWF